MQFETSQLLSLSNRNQGFKYIIKTLVSVLALLLLGATAFGQSCPTHGNGAHTIGASVNYSNGTQIPEGVTFAVGSTMRIDSIVTTSGGCETACTFYPNLVNHIAIWADISTTGGLNGTYSVGNIFGLNPDGTTGFFPELNSQASNSTGPISFTPAAPGTYTFHIQGIIDRHPNCPAIPDHTGVISITIQVGDTDVATEWGDASCKGVGEPVNVTTGNVYLHQTDYRLPGIGAGLEITRTYNSKKQVAGLFGFGWTSVLDESIKVYGTLLIRLNLADGRSVYLSRPNTAAAYAPSRPMDLRGQVVKNVNGSFTLTFIDGSVHQFNANGKLISFADRNGNTNTLNYTGSNPTSITDPSGRTITLTYDSYGLIGAMSDSTGTIATYTHGFWGRLTNVTYPDGSKFNFTDTFSGNFIYLASVTDALNNVLESHTYDSQGRALTSEKAGNGTERYTLTYVSATETDVTDALNHVTKYFFDTSKGRNLLTRVEGSCGCGNSQIHAMDLRQLPERHFEN